MYNHLKTYCHLGIATCLAASATAQTIGDFTSITPGPQTTDFVIPASHQFQKLIATGESISNGVMPGRLDFTAYVPIAGSSSNGYLSISSEGLTVGAVVIGDVSLNAGTGLWQFADPESIDFSSVAGTLANCSGAVTSWGTVISCEELQNLSDSNGDGYRDAGWAVEIDPATKTVIDKRWAMGNFQHENAAIHSNDQTVYQGVDNTISVASGGAGYLYKFVAASVQNLSSGNLYAYQGSKNGSGAWVQIANSTPTERNNTMSLSAAAGATVFDGIEDVEIGPDGWVYLAVKRENVVYRFQDSDALSGSSTVQMEIFVGGMSYNITHDGGTTSVPWGSGNDNLAFDGEGNLWVLQDGGNNYMWVVKNGHTQAGPQVEIFGRAPLGGEPTGITFTPDFQYLFMSIQHPSSSNSATSQIDAAGNLIDFATDVSLVISRVDVLPVELTAFTANPLKRSIEVTWTTATETNNDHFELERSEDGRDFTAISRIRGSGTTQAPRNYRYEDAAARSGRRYYYRLKQVDYDGAFEYSDIISAQLPHIGKWIDLRLSPNPLNCDALELDFIAASEGPVLLQIMDSQGRILQGERLQVQAGPNQQTMDLHTIPAAVYYLRLTDEAGGTAVESFIKTE